MRNRREQGMALITALLVLLLISSMIVGMSWLVLTDQKLGGNNADRQTAFYGAEAGMEALTTTLQNTFANNYALSATDISSITSSTATTTTNIPGVSYLNPDGTNGFQIQFTPDTSPTNLGNPTSQNHTILSGTYAGLVGLLTPYTLQVTSRTASGSEVRLQRTVQTVAIPVFQFGIFSDTDLSFFAGPDFDFGGRVHTNGNLWLGEGGGTLTMRDKVTAVGEIVRTNLENGWPLTTNYTGTVTITKNPGSNNFGNLSLSQGSTTGTSWFGHIAGTQETAFQTVSNTFNGNLANGATGVKALDLTIATPAIGGTAIDMLRPPVLGEDTANPAKLNERYYRQASLRIMLADYGPSGTCSDTDLTSLPMMSGGLFVDLAKLAWDTNSPNTNPSGNQVGKTPPLGTGWFSSGSIGTTVFPLPVSAATSAAGYTAADGYWFQKWNPIETGCIHIDYQKMDTTAFVDVTQEILKLGWTGRNINPQGGTSIPSGSRSPNRYASLASTAAQVHVSTCADPSPNAIIRLARVRDNPSTANTTGAFCTAGATTSQLGTDEWPNVLFDTREGTLRDVALATNTLNPAGQETLAGAMHYIELDVNNLTRWFRGTLGTSGASANNTTGYTVYFSDRRGDRKDPNSPASVGPGPAKTGGFGFDDFVNPNDANGCPDNSIVQAEDFESDFVHGTDPNPPSSPRIYGGRFPTDSSGTNPTTLWNLGVASLALPGVPASVLANNPTCTGAGKDWPFSVALDNRDLRENAPVFFRRALKLVNGGTITLGTCDAVACGLTIVSENPTYVQGDYNTANNGNFTTPFVAASVIADSVTLLSDSWNDVNSFEFPYNPNSRLAVTTAYRTAIVGGKTIPFKQPTVGSPPQDFGTDGGVHNFLRYIEGWGSGASLYYKGSIVAMFYSHQGVGTFKCCTTVYTAPNRGYSFQTEFLTPSLLPPRTPMFRDINTLGFTQLVLPTEGID